MPWSGRCAVVACGHAQALEDATVEVHHYSPATADAEAPRQTLKCSGGGCLCAAGTEEEDCG